MFMAFLCIVLVTDSTCQSYSGGHEARNDRPLSTEPSFFLATKGKGPVVTDDALLEGAVYE